MGLVAKHATGFILFAIAANSSAPYLVGNGKRLSKRILTGRHPPPLPLAPGQFLRPPCTAWGPYCFALQTCPPFCPPRSARPVDNSAIYALSDSKVMRPSSHQAGTLRSKAGPETEKRSGYRRNAGSPNGQATRRKTGNAVKMVGTKKTNIECGITQVMQRRIGYPRYQGEPRKPPGDIGEPDVRQRKKWPLWSRTSKLRRSGRW